jgi:hypothetical protein
MFRDLPLMLIAASIGLAYGILLAIMGFLAAGFGHGTYVVIGLSSAPCGLGQNVIFALIGAPLLWLLSAFLSGGSRHWAWRALYLFVMTVHYVSLPWILQAPSPFADWSYVHKVEGLFWAAIVFYCAGQIGLWGLAVLQTWKGVAPIAKGSEP